MNGALIRGLGGWHKIRVRGKNGEQLLSDGARAGYRIWRIERSAPDVLTSYVTEEGFSFLQDLADERHMGVESLIQGGLPVRWSQIKNRPFLGIGFLTSIILVLYVTSHIWAVQVSIPNISPSSENQLITVAEHAGIRLGSSRNGLNIPLIRQRMLQGLPQYTWIGIHVKGVVAVIDAVKLVPRPPDHLPAKLIATASGTVTAIDVYMGEPDVAPGEHVKRGQTLISGVVTGNPNLSNDGEKQRIEDSVITPAEGEVFADVTFQSRMFQSYRQRILIASGAHYVKQFLSFEPGKDYAIPTFSPMRYRYYSVTRTTAAVRWSGVKLPLRVIRMVYNEEVPHVIRLSGKAALAEGLRKTVSSMQRRVPDGSGRVSQRVAVKRGKDGLWITLTWVMNFNIASMPAMVHTRS